jgi:hypothetical protein
MKAIGRPFLFAVVYFVAANLIGIPYMQMNGEWPFVQLAVAQTVNPLDDSTLPAEAKPFATSGYVFNPMARRDPTFDGRKTDGFFENLANAWMLTGTGQVIQSQADRIRSGATAANRKNPLNPLAEYEDIRNFNAYQDVDLTGYEDNLEAFMDANSPSETSHIKRMIDRNRERRRDMEEGGAFSSGFVAEILNPITLIPILCFLVLLWTLPGRRAHRSRSPNWLNTNSG